MWFLALCVVFFLGAVAVYTWRSALVKYQFIFAKEHFLEFARSLADLKSKQLKSLNDKGFNELKEGLLDKGISDSLDKGDKRSDESEESGGGDGAGAAEGAEGSEGAGATTEEPAEASTEEPAEASTEEPAEEAPPHFITSAGLALLYSVQREGAAGQEVTHHLSLSYLGQPVAYAAATTFLAFTARLLGVAPERLQVSRSQHGIYHARFVMTEPEYEDFLRREVEIPYPDQIRAIQKECNEVRERHWSQFQLNPVTVKKSQPAARSGERQSDNT